MGVTEGVCRDSLIWHGLPRLWGAFERSPFKFCAAAKSGKSASIFSVSFRPSEERRKEGRFSRLVTCANLKFANQTFADGLNFSISYYKSPLDREEGSVGP